MLLWLVVSGLAAACGAEPLLQSIQLWVFCILGRLAAIRAACACSAAQHRPSKTGLIYRGSPMLTVRIVWWIGTRVTGESRAVVTLTAESSGREGNIFGRKSLRFLGSSLGLHTAMMPSPAAMLRRFTSSVTTTCAQYEQ